MEKQWLVAHSPRRTRAFFTVVGSIVLHGSIVAVAALWPVHDVAPAQLPPMITDIIDGPVPGELPPLVEACPMPPPEAEPAPSMADISTDTPPTPTAEPEMAVPPPRPPSKTVVNKTRSARAAAPAVSAQPGQPGVTNTARGAIGAAGAGRPGAAAGRWNTPQPPYPYAMRAARVQGNGSVRITTDGSGRVVSASVVQSTGNAVLDANTGQFARSNWSGPPNASVLVPITYQMR